MVRGELRLACRDQLPVLAHPVDVVNRDSAGLEERRADDETVRPAPTFGQRPGQRVGLGRVVTAQGGVAAAHDVEVRAGFGCGCREVTGDLPVQVYRLVLGEAAGVRQDVEGRARLRERPAQVIDRPGGEDRNAVHALDAGRVVVEYGNAPSALCYPALDLLQGS